MAPGSPCLGALFALLLAHEDTRVLDFYSQRSKTVRCALVY